MHFPACFWTVMIEHLFSVIPPLISHFEHGHFTLAQTIENLGSGEALNNLSIK